MKQNSMDVMNSKAMRIINDMPQDVRDKLMINDQTMGGKMDGTLER